MDLIKEMADAFLMLIRVGAVLRFIFCLIRVGTTEDDAAMYKKRARNVVVFYILAESIWQLKDIIVGYFSI